jgi:hypothetical protein
MQLHTNSSLTPASMLFLLRWCGSNAKFVANKQKNANRQLSKDAIAYESQFFSRRKLAQRADTCIALRIKIFNLLDISDDLLY